jgi:hypothetical protein
MPLRAVYGSHGDTYAMKQQTPPECSESVLRYTAYCTGDIIFVAAPCTRIITVIVQGWTIVLP